MDSIPLIRGFIGAGYTDEEVCGHYKDTGELDRPITAENFAEVVAACREVLGTAHDEFFASQYHRQTQYEFFVPTIRPYLGIKGCGSVYPAGVTLPINPKRHLGSGGSGVVFEAELLAEYYELEPGWVRLSPLTAPTSHTDTE
jgi:hypothetical protein